MIGQAAVERNLSLWELHCESGGEQRTVIVPATDSDDAVAAVQSCPWFYGLHENPQIGNPTRLTIRETALLIDDDMAA